MGVTWEGEESFCCGLLEGVVLKMLMMERDLTTSLDFTRRNLDLSWHFFIEY